MRYSEINRQNICCCSLQIHDFDLHTNQMLRQQWLTNKMRWKSLFTLRKLWKRLLFSPKLSWYNYKTILIISKTIWIWDVKSLMSLSLYDKHITHKCGVKMNYTWVFVQLFFIIYLSLINLGIRRAHRG